ncbi:Undecaprenyl-phosphate 4-deoxy-4-formamido-L-arabinose transferase [Lacunisphaera limnophila]|uniref:Undecaprenyl-phosphate 4-deoxy-4-formamido-L-arabinose transferase n=1 Tax=Lacunisphaera limnophila TaxID=1838286 RepID=A0A1D8AVK2_9BACT|nr:Undecaprenyl-phosphate 4-deoxy-4-formamido-L-arabinose transferase [Lacunisphaera limnophila]
MIPLYHSEQSIGRLLREIEGLTVEGGHEVVLVNDGSRDATASVCREFARTARIPVTFIEHARNFGEHNAVLTGYRHARGAHVVNIDDDGQNPPAEALRLWAHARREGLDVVYGHYARKEHSLFRNLGSWFTNRLTDWVLDKPRGFYLSSFRCVSAFAAGEAARYTGPFPYIDGLLLQVTQRIGAVTVEHAGRAAGESGYTLRRLLRLWVSTFVNFSVMPLRLATLLGLLMALAGLAGLGVVFYLRLTNQGPDYGWGTLMGALLVFSGAQLVMLGLIGEYLGRTFLTVNNRPQAVLRSVERSGG